MRLDHYLVQNAFADSRTKAQSIIKDGLVSIDGKVVSKSSIKVDAKDIVGVEDYKRYVSRSALKLSSFLDELNLDLKDDTALDIGSSTGGFTQVLLENGVKKVYAVDVGREQLHKSLQDDERVISFESCDIRTFKTKEMFETVVSDVSFISLLNILDDIDRLASSKIILLFKPQFEVGREAKRDSKGVVIDEKAISKAMQTFEDLAKLKGWELVEKTPSKLTGKEGNLEYCYYYKKGRLVEK